MLSRGLLRLLLIRTGMHQTGRRLFSVTNAWWKNLEIPGWIGCSEHLGKMGKGLYSRSNKGP